MPVPSPQTDSRRMLQAYPAWGPYFPDVPIASVPVTGVATSDLSRKYLIPSTAARCSSRHDSRSRSA